MEAASILVEMADYRTAKLDEFAHAKGLFHFKDFGIERPIARARLINYNVFAGAYYGLVPVLRLATEYEQGQGMCLSQVLNLAVSAPVMGITAVLAPQDERLWDKEKQIARTAFEQATADSEK